MNEQPSIAGGDAQSPELVTAEFAPPALELSPTLDGSETIVRSVGLKDSKNDRLHHRAFKPRVGTNENSVTRLLVGEEEVKIRSRSAFDNRHDDYAGVAVCRVDQVQTLGVDVIDAPATYVGHANMIHPYPSPNLAPQNPEDPQLSRTNEEADEHYKKVATLFRFIRDSAPLQNSWSDGPMTA